MANENETENTTANVNDSVSTTETKTFPGQSHYVSEIDETGLGAVDAVADDRAPSSTWGEAWKHLRKRPLFWVAAVIILFAILLALFPGMFTRMDPKFCELKNSYASPSVGHPFGFDRQGCDIFARTIYGAKASVTVGILTTIAVAIIGGAFGTLAGYFGGWLDEVLSRITDIVFAVPFLLAGIVVMQMFRESRNTFTVVLVLAVFGWPQIARITRGAVIQTKNEEFVNAAKALGENKFRIILRHIVPNAAAPMIVYATVALGTFIVSEATLSFLGVGLPSDVVSWGGDISRAQSSLRQDPAVLFYPAGALALTVLSFIMMGDVIRDALNPKARK